MYGKNRLSAAPSGVHTESDRGWSRRDMLKSSAATAAGLTLGSSAQAPAQSPAGEDVSFFVVADTHYLAKPDKPTQMAPRTTAVNERLIDLLNRLPGQPLPDGVGGGTVAEPRGVIHMGDMVDSGDKHGRPFEQMTGAEWNKYVEDFGMTGSDGRLRYPVYEMHGNHDSPRQRNLVLQGVADRNKDRPGLTHISKNGMHYSWDWGGLHFVALGIVVGHNRKGLLTGRYAAHESLPFLIDDLQRNVGDSGRPVILLHHIDLLRYSKPCDESETGVSRHEWGGCDVRAYRQAIRPYNIAAIFHGHLHGRRIHTWDGTAESAETGIPVFGCDNSGAGGVDRGFFYCRVEDGELVVREQKSRGEHGWTNEQADVHWGPQVWRAPLNA